jgi:ribosomal protein L11 methyltransferase
LAISQAGLPPIRAGRFYIHGSHVAASSEPGIRNLHIDASQAFGTGHHETTLGCVRLLDAMRRRGAGFSNIIDVGTGSGVLALAATYLWPNARVTASDLDRVAVNVARGNVTGNGFRLGKLHGQIALLTANGVDHPVIRRRASYDLIIANILAGPLSMLAPHFAAVAAPGSTLILAGLLRHQQAGVTTAYVRAGYRLDEVLLENEWPCLRLIKRRNRATPKRFLGRKSPLADDYFGEC